MKLWAMTLLWVSTVAAADSHLLSTITLDDAVREALQKNLSILAERYNISVADARIIQARLRPNPVFTTGLDYQDWLGTGFTVENGASR